MSMYDFDFINQSEKVRLNTFKRINHTRIKIAERYVGFIGRSIDLRIVYRRKKRLTFNFSN